MKRSSQTSLSAFFKKARTEIQTEQENKNEPAEIECENGTTSTSAMVSINISQSSQCDVIIQSTSASTTTSISSINSSTTCNTSTAGCASITITVYNDISKSKDDDPVQPMNSSFPKKDMFGKMRSFQTSWYKEFEYSKGNDAIYCFCCRHFPSLSGKHEDAFKSGFSNWHKAVEKLRKHSESVSHKNSMEMWTNYMQARVSGTVVENITKQSAIQTKENREYIKILARVAILCAKQEIALRGHREGPESLNKGNFGNP